jgi:hypothetical protein
MKHKNIFVLAAVMAVFLAACPQGSGPGSGSDLALLSCKFATGLPCDTLILTFSEPVKARDANVFEVTVGSSAARALENARTIAVKSVTPVESTLKIVLVRQVTRSESVELTYKGGISPAAGGPALDPLEPVPVSLPTTSGNGGGGGGGGTGGGNNSGNGDTSPAAPGAVPYAVITFTGIPAEAISSGDTLTITAGVSNPGTEGTLSVTFSRSPDGQTWSPASSGDFGYTPSVPETFPLAPWREDIGCFLKLEATYTYTYTDPNYPANNGQKTAAAVYTGQIADRVANMAKTSCFVDLLPDGNADGTRISITPEAAAAGLQYAHASAADPGRADVYLRNGTVETTANIAWAASNDAILAAGLIPDQDYTIYAAPYVVINGKNLYMAEPGTIPYYVIPRRGFPTSSMTAVRVTQGDPQGIDGTTYPGTYSVTIDGTSPGTYALTKDQSSEFSAWWDANNGGNAVFDTTGCFYFTFANGGVTKIELENTSFPITLTGRGIKVTRFSPITEVMMGRLDTGGGSATLSIADTPLFRIPSGTDKTFRGTIEIGHDVEYRNENASPWDGISSNSVLRFKWGSTVYLNAADYQDGRPFIAPQWKGTVGAEGQTFIWETMSVSNGSSVELRENGSVRVDGKITAIKPYALTGNWTITGGSMFTIAMESGSVFDVTGYRIEGALGALPIANSNIKHLSGTILQLNRPNGSRSDLTATSERIYDWYGSSSTGGWIF